jgi:hypothetical protein
VLVAASHARGDIYWFDLSDWGWQGSEFTLHGHLGEHVWFSAFAVIPFDRYRMVAFVAGTLPAPVSSDVVRPACAYLVHLSFPSSATHRMMHEDGHSLGNSVGSSHSQIMRLLCGLMVGESEQE